MLFYYHTSTGKEQEKNVKSTGKRKKGKGRQRLLMFAKKKDTPDPHRNYYDFSRGKKRNKTSTYTQQGRDRLNPWHSPSEEREKDQCLYTRDPRKRESKGPQRNPEKEGEGPVSLSNTKGGEEKERKRNARPRTMKREEEAYAVKQHKGEGRDPTCLFFITAYEKKKGGRPTCLLEA